MTAQAGYAVEVISLSPNATEKDISEFFFHCGAIENIEIVRYGDCDCTAYVIFKDAYSQETACLLSGATIIDQRVCVTPWGQCRAEFDFWNTPTWRRHEDTTHSTPTERSQYISNAGEAVNMAQEMVITMLAKGYVLGKDALGKAKQFDESHQVSASTATKVAELSQRIGVADKISVGVEAFKNVDEKYHVLEMTKAALLATGQTATAATNTVVNSSYFSKGALWLSGALDRAAKVVADVGTSGVER